MSEPRLLDVAQAAKRWNVCVQTIRDWIRRGKLQAVRTPSGYYRIPESALPSFSSTKAHETTIKREGHSS